MGLEMSNSEEQEELQIGRKITDDIIDESTTERLKKNGMVIGLFVIIVLAAVGYYYYSTTQAEKDSLEASMALSKVLPEYDSGNYSVALDGGTSSTGVSVEGLATIVSKYGGTNEGKLAALYAGNAYVSTNQYDQARTYFDKATDSEASVVQSGAYAGLALCEEEAGNYEKAAENYEKAAEKLDEETLKTKYLYYAALNYEQANKKDEAKKIYNNIIDIAENSEFGNRSKAKLSMLGTKID